MKDAAKGWNEPSPPQEEEAKQTSASENEGIRFGRGLDQRIILIL